MMEDEQTSISNSGRPVVATILAICGVIFAAAAAIMDPSATRMLMTGTAVVFIALAGVMLGLALRAKRRT